MLNRRSFFMGALAAPLVVKTPGLLMQVRPPVFGNQIQLGDIIRIVGPTGTKRFVVTSPLYLSDPWSQDFSLLLPEELHPW